MGLLGGLNFGDIGTGISDLFGAAGDQAEANAYGTAAQIANQNAQLEAESTAIQQAQTNRKIYQTLGAQQAGVAAGGFSSTGSARALLQNSAQQAGLQKQVLEVQGDINVNAYKQAAAAYTGQQNAAIASSKAGTGAGIFSLIGGVAGIFGL